MKPPAEAGQVFGDRLPLAERYAAWLTGPGIERGLLGPREADRIWSRHLLNSAALAPVLPEQPHALCDIGSGAGLPGLVLAVLRPDVEVVLLEPLLRRATFLEEVVADLDLPRVRVARARAEEYRHQLTSRTGGRDDRFDVVTARAVAPLDRLAGWALPLLRPGGMLLALKGESAEEELTDWLAAGPRSVAAAEVRPVERGGTVTRVVRVVRGEGR